jgi:hypothetical protein
MNTIRANVCTAAAIYAAVESQLRNNRADVVWGLFALAQSVFGGEDRIGNE